MATITDLKNADGKMLSKSKYRIYSDERGEYIKRFGMRGVIETKTEKYGPHTIITKQVAHYEDF